MILLSFVLVIMAMDWTGSICIDPLSDMAEFSFTVPPTTPAIHLLIGIIVMGLELESETETSKLHTTPMEPQCFK